MARKMRELGILVTRERQMKQQEVNLGGHKAKCHFQILFLANDDPRRWGVGVVVGMFFFRCLPAHSCTLEIKLVFSIVKHRDAHELNKPLDSPWI